MMNKMIYDRIRGALYGVAVGDALGGPLEFMDAETIKAKHGRVTEMIGGGWLYLTPGETTDDTAMTLCVARGIVENPEDPIPAIGRNFIEWGKSGPKDIGTTCSAAIRQAIANNATTAGDWEEVGYTICRYFLGKNGGNGALMRTIYPALFYADRGVREQMTTAIGSMTHRNFESDGICEIYANAVHNAIFGGHPIATIEPDLFYTPNAKPTGYVVDTWSNALDSILSTETFEDAIVEAVNRGGDADTIGAIAGGLAGAWYGYANIPERWITRLDPELCKELDELAEIAYKANDDYYHTKYTTLK